MSEATVPTHVSPVRAALAMTSRVHAAILAQHAGWLS